MGGDCLPHWGRDCISLATSDAKDNKHRKCKDEFRCCFSIRRYPFKVSALERVLAGMVGHDFGLRRPTAAIIGAGGDRRRCGGTALIVCVSAAGCGSPRNCEWCQRKSFPRAESS
jgi:hypothetical protein